MHYVFKILSLIQVSNDFEITENHCLFLKFLIIVHPRRIENKKNCGAKISQPAA